MFVFFFTWHNCGDIIKMKCPADVVTGCDSEPECDVCGFCMRHCICDNEFDNDYEGWYYIYMNGIRR